MTSSLHPPLTLSRQVHPRATSGAVSLLFIAFIIIGCAAQLLV